MIYGYRCRRCNRTYDSQYRVPNLMCFCGSLAKRDYRSVTIRPSSVFQPHYNHSVGAYVQTELEFRDALKRRAEENSIRTGIGHTYEMIDPADLAREEPTRDLDILETRARVLAGGQPPPAPDPTPPTANWDRPLPPGWQNEDLDG